MLNVKGKPITFADWKRVARFYEKDVSKLDEYMAKIYANDSDEVNEVEHFLFGKIFGCPASGSANGL